jgi:hypothetical protein
MKGVDKDAPTVVNSEGGKQSKVEYRFDLVPPHALADVAEILYYGALKYGEDNWHNIESGSHLNHALTHINAFRCGDTSDDHAEHAACRIMMWLEMLHKEND